MTARSKVAAGLCAIAVGLVAVAALMVWPRGTTAISQQDAVEDFRARDLSANTSTPSSRRSVPAPGVYTYAAEGEGEVKLGPLPAETRPLPPTVTAIAVDVGEGCFDWTLNLLAEHTETTRWCTDPSLRLDGHSKHQRIGALSPTATLVCDPNQMPGDETSAPPATTRLSCMLELSGGPTGISAHLAGTATRGEPTTIEVGGAEVGVTPINVHYSVTGALSGTWDETTWWTSEHLPARIERTLDLSGPATFSESSKLELAGVVPTS